MILLALILTYVLNLSSSMAHLCYLPNLNRYFMWTAEVSLLCYLHSHLSFCKAFSLRDGSKDAHSWMSPHPTSAQSRLLTCTFNVLTDLAPALLTNLWPHLVLLSLHSLSFRCTAVFLLKRKKTIRITPDSLSLSWVSQNVHAAFPKHLMEKTPMNILANPKFSFLFIWVIFPTPTARSSCDCLHLVFCMSAPVLPFHGEISPWNFHIMEMSLFCLLGAGAAWAKMLRYIHLCVCVCVCVCVCI